jgi:flagellar biosynthesis protein FliR
VDDLLNLVTLFLFAILRFLPVVAIPSMSPLGWAPPMVRIALLIALAWMTVLSLPSIGAEAHWRMPLGLALAAVGELLVGMTFGLALLLPNAALHSAGWLVDMQAGLGASTLFDPGSANAMESLMGRALMLASVVLFFTLDLHLMLFRGLGASLRWLPLGAIDIRLDLAGFFGMLGASFLLGLMVVVPVVLGLFAIDVGVAYATRSMPQANVYFLVLPLKIAAGLFLMAMSTLFAPELIGRLFRDAFQRIPAVFGAG